MTYSESSVKKRKKINLKLIRKLSKSISNNEHRAIILLFLETRISPKKLVKLRFEDFEFTTCTIKINEKRTKISLELSLLLKSISLSKKRYFFSISTRRIRQILQKIGCNYLSIKKAGCGA
ncbi:hypothetical protein HN789_06165 [archaeon]|jgi:integrase|nr:hypothetical protein [archaeon]MBT3721283.1 hypothetical protein [archaeon]MBT4022354.1 hypothetical protein [archaeon]MBT4273232.1 hypothetical protein [archaeon]MBT4461325.1 hypothetical protein [archaeon]